MRLLFFLELLVLFCLSRALTSGLSLLFHKIFKSQRISVWLIAIIFLPGTIIHEFSHAIMAKFLFVHVGKMELVPRLNGESLKLGSVEVGKTDLIRNFFIGIAPFVTGLSLLLLILYISFSKNIVGLNLMTGVVLYFIFVISNTMYSSKKDMEGAVEFFLLLVAPVLVLYFLGVRIPGISWGLIENKSLEGFFNMSVIFLAVPLILDTAFILFAKLTLRK